MSRYLLPVTKCSARRVVSAVLGLSHMISSRDALDVVGCVECEKMGNINPQMLVVCGTWSGVNDRLGRCRQQSRTVDGAQSAVGWLTREMHWICPRSLHAGVPMEESWNGAVVATRRGMRSWSRLGVCLVRTCMRATLLPGGGLGVMSTILGSWIGFTFQAGESGRNDDEWLPCLRVWGRPPIARVPSAGPLGRQNNLGTPPDDGGQRGVL